MKTIIVLAMHGSPPNDFPEKERVELLGMHARLARANERERVSLERHHAELESKMRRWPRTEKNDPYYSGSMDLAGELHHSTGLEVIAGFNEFCAPSLDEALDQAASKGAEKVIVITPMMTRGGEHAGEDIPEAIDRARAKHPEIRFTYAWPFETSEIAEFLSSQIEKHE